MKSDEVVADKAPILPETATTERTDAEAEANKIEQHADEEVAKENAKEEPKEEVATPTKEKSKFLSFINKRGRSVSPSQAVKSEPEAPKEEAVEPAKVEEAPVEPAAAPEVVPEATDAVEKPAEKIEEPAKTETTTANKRQSFIGSLGRRASKALGGSRKKENVVPTAESKEESAEAPTEEAPKVNGEAAAVDAAPQQTIGDVVPEAIHAGQPQTVTASA